MAKITHFDPSFTPRHYQMIGEIVVITAKVDSIFGSALRLLTTVPDELAPALGRAPQIGEKLKRMTAALKAHKQNPDILKLDAAFIDEALALIKRAESIFDDRHLLVHTDWTLFGGLKGNIDGEAVRPADRVRFSTQFQSGVSIPDLERILKSVHKLHHEALNVLADLLALPSKQQQQSRRKGSKQSNRRSNKR